MSSASKSSHSRSLRSSSSSASRYRKSSTRWRSSLSILRARDFVPVFRLKHPGPVHVEAQLIVIAEAARDLAGQVDLDRWFVAAHLIIGRMAPANKALCRAGHLNPIIHVVLFEDACRTEAILRDEAHDIFDLGRGGFVDDRPAPNLHLVGPAGLPNPDCAREPMNGKIGEDRSCRRRDLPRAHRAEPPFNLFAMLLHIIDELIIGLRKPRAAVRRRDP